jgi:hypothetical protein
MPVEALREASARREEMLPRLLAEIEAWLASDDEPEVPSAIFFVFHLLGSWRAAEAYRPLCRVLRADPERIDWELDDAITETAPRVIANVFDGDLGPLCDVITDAGAEAFTRGSMIRAMGVLFQQGRLSREALVETMRDLPRKLGDAPPQVWNAWAGEIADHGLVELRALAEAAFDEGRIETVHLSRADFDRAFAEAGDLGDLRRFEPFGDVEKELAGWQFVDVFADEDDDELDEDELDALPQDPAVNPFRHVGRNDPCPCGSGKKFKKCCGR